MKQRYTYYASVTSIGLIIAAVILLAPTIDQAAAPSFTEQEAGFDAEPNEQTTHPQDYVLGAGGWYSLAELTNWERPAGPLRVGIQIGHLNNQAVPEELAGLTRNGAGATYDQFNERDTVTVIAELVATTLTAHGYAVDILPATVPTEILR